MKISEVIESLQAQLADHGDIDVCCLDCDTDTVEVTSLLFDPEAQTRYTSMKRTFVPGIVIT